MSCINTIPFIYLIYIENILGIDKEQSIILVGAGKLGSALLGFEGFSKFNLRIIYAFDTDKNKIGRIKRGVRVLDLNSMQNIVARENVKVAIISTPPEVANDVAERLVRAGIKGILNFTPEVLKVPAGVSVSNVDMACELESLIFLVRHK